MNLLKTTIFCFVLFFSVTLFSQEAQPPSEPGNPPEFLAQIQSESEMTKDVNILNDIYHKDIEIYLLPDKLVAKGKEEALKYWEERFKNQGDIAVELMEVIQAENGTAYRTKKSDPRLNKAVITLTLIQTKDGKIRRLFF